MLWSGSEHLSAEHLLLGLKHFFLGFLNTYCFSIHLAVKLTEYPWPHWSCISANPLDSHSALINSAPKLETLKRSDIAAVPSQIQTRKPKPSTISSEIPHPDPKSRQTSCLWDRYSSMVSWACRVHREGYAFWF